MNHRKAVPAEGVHTKHVPEELGNIAKLVVFITVDGVVVLGEGLFKQVAPEAVDFGKPFTDEAKELCVCLFLGAAFDNHGGQLGFLAGGQVDLHEFVDSFFGVGARHDCEVDCSSEVD